MLKAKHLPFMHRISPTRGYVICSEHRTGTTLLCQLLASTGKLGKPDEYFRKTEFGAQFEKNPKQLDDLLVAATTANGVYGLKVFSNQFDVTTKARWTERLPNLRFLHLERHDLLGQAISYVKAFQTGRYLSGEPTQRDPHYDRREIDRHLRRIADGHMRWRLYFARNGIQPLWLTYEALLKDPQAAVDSVARHLGIDENVPVDPSLVDLRPLKDATSDEWRRRYIAEAADLNYLDHRFGKGRIWLRRLARNGWYVTYRAKEWLARADGAPPPAPR